MTPRPITSTTLRRKLLIGASLSSLILAGGASAQNFGSRGTVNPAAQAARAVEQAASQANSSAAAAVRVRASLEHASRVRAQMDAVQQAARAAAQAAQANIANGLTPGGLQVAQGVGLDPNLWIGAKGPTQSQGTDGRTKVNVDQTDAKAILTWDSFNVGKETDLTFDHKGNTAWVTLNRVTDASADPSKILGSIKADGTVLVLNRNGVIFGGASTVNVRNLVAATGNITNEHFNEYGIYARQQLGANPWDPTVLIDGLTNAGGKVEVQAGALITTSKPKSVVETGGYVMLLGTEVHNAGKIVTEKGQTVLGAGDNFTIRTGYGTENNATSTTRGNEIAVTVNAGSTAGLAVNTGVIEARQGDITIAGENVVQGGVAISTTDVHTRGTIHLLTNVANTKQNTSVTLTKDSLTLILPELDSKETASDAQRNALTAPAVAGTATWLNNQGQTQGNFNFIQPDRGDRSRVEIATGGTVVFEGGSHTIAQGGQISVFARTKAFVGDGAVLDVSGVRGVVMDMASNNLLVNLQPYEMRDSAINREVEALKHSDIWIDIRDLTLLPSGTGGHDGDRYYTPGGLMEVGGHLLNMQHGIGEWVSTGGTINFASGSQNVNVTPQDTGQLVIQKGALLDVSGGSLDYAAGLVRSTLFRGSDGKLYAGGNAPAGVKLVAVGASTLRRHERWGEAYDEHFSDKFTRTHVTRWEDGYTVGRDAGSVTLAMPTLLMEGTVAADVIIGDRQNQARPDLPITFNELGQLNQTYSARLDGYKLPQYVTPLAGGLYVGNGMQFVEDARQPTHVARSNVTIASGTDLTSGMNADIVLDPALRGNVQLSAEAINQANLGELRVSGTKVNVEADLAVSNGGAIVLRGRDVQVGGNLTARSGTIAIEGSIAGCNLGCEALVTNVDVREGVTLDTSGLFVNLEKGGDRRDLAFIKGGDILIESEQGSLRLGTGSLLDASAGGAVLERNETQGAKGGDVLLSTGTLPRANVNEMVLSGEIRSYGSGEQAGGTLILNNGGRAISIGENPFAGGNVAVAGQPLPTDLQLSNDVVLPAGTVLPFDFAYQITSVKTGDLAPGNIYVEWSEPMTLPDGWIVPEGVEVYDMDFNWYPGGSELPPGFEMALGYFSGGAGAVIPDLSVVFGTDVIQLTNPINAAIPAGTPMETSVTLSKGMSLQKGWTFNVDIEVGAPLHLEADFFQKGFSNYAIRAGGDILIGGDKPIDVTVPVRQFTPESLAAANGTAAADALTLWTPEMFREDAANGRFIQRQGANLSLSAMGQGDLTWTNGYGQEVRGIKAYGDITLAEGTTLRVDDGRAIKLYAGESVYIGGRIEARGGSVDITSAQMEGMNRDNAVFANYDPTRSIWVDTGASIDVSGRANSAVDLRGLRYASVSKGGSIHMGGLTSMPTGMIEARPLTSAYVVVREGAVLDVSGASATADYLSGTVPEKQTSITISTDGGRMAFDSQYGVFLDGDLRGHAGGAGALGGELSIMLSTPIVADPGVNNGKAVPNFMRRLRNVIVDEVYENILPDDAAFGTCFTGCWTPGQLLTDANAANEGMPDLVGTARVGADRIKSGGFDSFGAQSDDMILFNGSVNLSLGRNLTLGGTIGNFSVDGDVELSAAYVNFSRGGNMWGITPVFSNKGDIALPKRPDIGEGSITVRGGLVDLAGISFGTNGSIGLIGNELLDFEYAVSRNINIISQSDIRLTGGTTRSMSDIHFTAAQIYPTTNAVSAIYAGQYSYRFPGNTSIYTTLMSGGTISFTRLPGSTPSAPLSAFGQVTVGADIINQGGVLVAPLGRITLGVGGNNYVPGLEEAAPGQTYWPGDSYFTTREVNLLPGSITSVSANGLNIPYGGTTDGLTWMLNGASVTTAGNAGMTIVGSLRADAGSVVDLSGGGMATGAGFTPGRGGSIDILKTALANANPAYAGISDAGNKVYAIVPTYQNSAAPKAIDGHAQPEFGQQIMVPEGVPGLKAGTYMLLPAEYALMEGAFRVEMGKVSAPTGRITTMPDGSVALGVHTGVANLSTVSSLPSNVILTPSKVVRTHSLYNETTFEDFMLKLPDTTLFGRPLPLLPRDGKQFLLAVTGPKNIDRPIFSFKGEGRFAPAKDGMGGSLTIAPGNYGEGGKVPIEILADGMLASEGAIGMAASDINAVGARMVLIGGEVQRLVSGTGAAVVAQLNITPGASYGGLYSYSGFNGITVREGATLEAGQILLISDGHSDITIERGATLTTLGMGDPAFDSNSGFTIGSGRSMILAVSNGLLELGAPTNIGATGVIRVEDGASVYSDGTIAFSTLGPVDLGQDARYGARYLGLSTAAVNIGTAAGLATAAEQNILPDGIPLNQTVLERLMSGDKATGVPALERLILTASNSINFYGTVDLDTRGADGKSALQLVLNTPALYGHGGAGDVATISAGTLVWNGVLGTSGPQFSSTPIMGLPGGIIANGPGTGSGKLNLIADRLVLGYQDGIKTTSNLPLDRLVAGFADVNLTGLSRIESNHKAKISVFQSVSEQGKPGIGGNLNFITPLMTAAASSTVEYIAGGTVGITAPQGWTAPTARPDVPIGGEIHITAASIDADTMILLPSGRLKLTATQGDVTLSDRARLDVSGQATDFFDETRYSWGGDVELESTHGNVTMAQGAAIDLSADYNHAGLLKVTALSGTADLAGTIKGQARNGQNPADPSLRNGGIDVRASTLADFVGLNQRLTESGVTETRGFIVKTGDLVIGDEVKARNVSISADGGSLTVNGRIDASGFKPGSIRLSARDDLTLAGSAVLDARASTLWIDSYGAPIEASNRGQVELTSVGGTLALQTGATIDLTSPDNVARGRIELNARRLGANDVAIAAAGSLNVKGADSLSVNAFRQYQPAGGVIDQALLDGIHGDSDLFVDAAIGNADLLGRMAGLRAYGSAFHFRPGVELVSATGGDLRVSGDLNLAGYRYNSLNPNVQRAGNYADPLGDGYGSGEAGTLLIRAADQLDINGSITDGFGVPARTPDDNGWVLYPGAQSVNSAWIQDYRVPVPVRLGAGTRIQAGNTLGYAIEVNGFNVNAHTALGTATTLSQAFVLGQQWVARADITLPDGSVIARGTIMEAGTQLPAGSRLGAGSVLPATASIAAMTWPADTRMPALMTLSTAAQLQAGDLIPADTSIAQDFLSGVLTKPITLTSSMELLGSTFATDGTSFPSGVNSSFVLAFDVPVRPNTQLRSGVTIPFGFANSGAVNAPAGGWVATAPIWASRADYESGAAPIFQAGQTVTVRVPVDSWFGAGSVLPGTFAAMRATTIPAGTPLNIFRNNVIYVAETITVPAGTVLEAGTNVQRTVLPGADPIRPVQADGTQGRTWGAAAMLPAGSQSWSMRFVAGADLGSADGRALRAASELAEAGQNGNLTLADRHYLNPGYQNDTSFTQDWRTRLKDIQVFSVLRTGTGSLDLLAGGSYQQYSLFGVYTAGTPSAEIGGTTPDGFNVYDQPRAILAGGANLANPWIGAKFDGYADSIRDYQAWYPEHGGDLLLSAQGSITGFNTSRSTANVRQGSGTIGNWLWRQGGYGVTEGDGTRLGQDIPTAWWIHFGGYVPNNPSSYNDISINHNAPLLTGFMGIGTLGGGNLTVSAGRDVGTLNDPSFDPGASYYDSNRGNMTSTALNFTVAATGRVTEVTRQAGFVTGGEVVQTGGGEMTIRIGGSLNPVKPVSGGNSDMSGTLVNMRGNIDVLARSIGGVTLAPGDGTASLHARGTLILSGVADPGAVVQLGEAGTALGYVDANGNYTRPDGQLSRSSFTLWQEDTAVHLFAGGNLTPVTLGTGNAAARDMRYWYPPILTATSTGGDITWDGGVCGNDCFTGIPALELSPSRLGQVEFLAMGSISGSAILRQDAFGELPAMMPIALSGMTNSPDLLPNIFRPAWISATARTPDASATTLLPTGNISTRALTSNYIFQRDTASGQLLEGLKDPALFYAVEGDIRKFAFGMTTWEGLTPIYTSSGSATIRAGRDIVNLGTVPAIGCGPGNPVDCRGTVGLSGAFMTAGLVVHSDPRDITLISAGRDIAFANMTVAGPGNLIVEAGRNVYQADQGRFTSAGPLFGLTPETRNGGASITVLTGVGAGGPRYDDFANLYLNPANLADAAFPLVHPENEGKVVKTYEVELTDWLQARYGFTAETPQAALDYFDTLKPVERGIFARQVYYDELKAGGREYNDAEGPRFASYLRGRNAIAVLFPEKDADGQAISYQGDLTMFGGSGVRTLFGGNVELLVAGGQTTVGVGGLVPPSTAGVLSMGSGDVDIYSLGSVLLGQSRVFTTFGGDLFIWSAQGDINAGRGSKSTAVYQPPRRVYDMIGNATLSPPTQNTGAGIATLNPIPEIPPGDIDLIAPLGVIDAGEAGIRVSGDINLAALQVLNAANIQVQGDATGIPLIAVVNVGALTAASSATGAITNQAAQLAERNRPRPMRDIPSIITGRLLGFGE